MIKSSGYFIKDGIDSRMYDLYMVYLDDGNMENFGYNRTEKEQSYHNFPIDYGFENSSIPTIKITLARIQYNMSVEWDNDFRRIVSEWLFTDTYTPIYFEESLDLCFYGKFIKGERCDFGTTHGYVTLELKIASPYAWTRPYITTFMTREYKPVEVEFENRSNTEDEIKPFIEIQPLDDCNYVILEHLNSNKKMSFKNIPNKGVIRINNLIEDMVCTKDYKFKDFNREWISLHKGTNKFKIYGKCQVTFKAQYSMNQ